MISFERKGKRKSFAEWLRKQDIANILHELEMATYKTREQKQEVNRCFRAAIESMALHICKPEDSVKFKSYLKKGY